MNGKRDGRVNTGSGLVGAGIRMARRAAATLPGRKAEGAGSLAASWFDGRGVTLVRHSTAIRWAQEQLGFRRGAALVGRMGLSLNV